MGQHMSWTRTWPIAHVTHTPRWPRSNPNTMSGHDYLLLEHKVASPFHFPLLLLIYYQHCVRTTQQVTFFLLAFIIFTTWPTLGRHLLANSAMWEHSIRIVASI